MKKYVIKSWNGKYYSANGNYTHDLNDAYLWDEEDLNVSGFLQEGETWAEVKIVEVNGQ